MMRSRDDYWILLFLLMKNGPEVRVVFAKAMSSFYCCHTPPVAVLLHKVIIFLQRSIGHVRRIELLSRASVIENTYP